MKKIVEGKTKALFEAGEGKLMVKNKDDITAGDGARRDLIPGKGAIACETTVNVFRLLEANNVKTHYLERPEPNEILVKKCEMIPIECVARRIATGHYLERHPEVAEGTRFEPLVIEFFLKDDARHDPLISRKEMVEQGIVSEEEVNEMASTLERVFTLLENAWKKQGVVFVDLKIEFGRFAGGLVVADVIDNDSWRIWPGGTKDAMLDKQVYRNAPKVTREVLDEVKANYAKVAELTKKFVE